jgi:hypothetical protein
MPKVWLPFFVHLNTTLFAMQEPCAVRGKDFALQKTGENLGIQWIWRGAADGPSVEAA